LTLVIGLSACQQPGPIREQPPAVFSEVAGLAFGPDISAEDFAEHVKVLASDEFGGRAPGSAGEDKTVEYLREQFRRLGLAPGNGDSYAQTVPMVKTTVDTAHSSLQVRVGGQMRRLGFGDEMVIGSRTGKAQISIKDSPARR
jgi:hypothetical protein